MHAPRLRLQGPSGLVLLNTTGLRFEMQNEEGERVGLVGFENRTKDSVELYYSVEKPYRRRGFACGAAETACHWMFEEKDVSRIVAVVNKHNVASQKVLEQCGFAIHKIGAQLFYWEKFNPSLPGF